MIQSLAAAERLPAHSVSRFDRDNGSLATPRKGITVVWFNAWWGEAWPHARTPHKNIVPILTGVHASGSFAQQLAHSERMRAWFRRHGPVGARDFGTVRLFSSLGIPAWFSGCPTSLTSRPANLPPPASDARAAPVIIIDVPAIDRVPQYIAARAKTLSQNTAGCGHDDFALARQQLREMASAGLVITTRLHVASPAVAMGVRVIFVTQSALAGGGGGRLEGMNQFFWTDRDADLLPSWYDVPRGPKNRSGWEAMRASILRETDRVITRARFQTPSKRWPYQCALTSRQWPELVTPTAPARVIGMAAWTAPLAKGAGTATPALVPPAAIPVAAPTRPPRFASICILPAASLEAAYSAVVSMCVRMLCSLKRSTRP